MNESVFAKALNHAGVEYVRKSVALAFDGKPVVECGVVFVFIQKRWREFWKALGRIPTCDIQVSFPKVVSDDAPGFFIRGVEIDARPR